LGIREVFEVSVEDMVEVHLHPRDMRAAIVSLSEPRPPESWRWGGPDWDGRSVPLAVVGASIGVADPAGTEKRWAEVIGASPRSAGIRFEHDDAEPGLVEIVLEGGPPDAFELAGVRFTPSDYEEE
jgi:hypothetical protein